MTRRQSIRFSNGATPNTPASAYGRKDTVLSSQKLSQVLGKENSQFLPCEQFQATPKFEEAHRTHNSIPGFHKIRTASITKDAERAIRGIGRERTPNQLIAAIPIVAHGQLRKIKDSFQIRITMD